MTIRKIYNSDDATTFVSDPVHEERYPEYGADPMELLMALEEQQGYPMNTRCEPLTLRKQR